MPTLNPPKNRRIGALWWQTTGVAIAILAVFGSAASATGKGLNPQIKVGIVQRFGETAQR